MERSKASLTTLCLEARSLLRSFAFEQGEALSTAKREAEAARADVHRITAERSVHHARAKKRFVRLSWWMGLARWLSRSDVAAIETLTAERDQAIYAYGMARRRGERLTKALTRSGRVFRALNVDLSKLTTLSLTEETRIAAFERRLDLLTVRTPDPKVIYSFALEILHFVRGLPDQRFAPVAVENPEPRARVAIPRKPLPERRTTPVVDQRRVNLPIPMSKWPLARRLGALEDDQAAPGVSPFYLTPGMDIRPFMDILPGMLDSSSSYAFPPVQFAAAGQNLWTIFDKDTWDHVRTSSYAMTGHRCSICGGRGGPVASKLFPDGSRDGVDCHEVWEWKKVDVGAGVGIQRLKKLLVVCVSCHAAFHEGYFVRKGDEIGIGDEIASHVERRRMLMNGMDAQQVREQVERERETFQSMNGVRDWIVDLEYLSRQQFMSDRMPILREGNRAGISPERIAGIEFETDSGIPYERNSVMSVAEDLVRSRIVRPAVQPRQFSLDLGHMGVGR